MAAKRTSAASRKATRGAKPVKMPTGGGGYKIPKRPRPSGGGNNGKGVTQVKNVSLFPTPKGS